MNKNYYHLLGLKETATPLEIKDAYRKLSKKIHPDLNQGEPFFEEYFKEVKEAYENLSDQEKKRHYDTRRFRPTVTSSAPVMPSNFKNLEYQVSRLELKLKDQTEQMNVLLAEKKSLNQEMEYFVKALFEVKNERSLLQKKVKELEQEGASSKKNQQTVNNTAEAEKQLELQRIIQTLEKELQKSNQKIIGKTEELARETQLKQALEKRIQEMALEAGQQDHREKQLQSLAQETDEQKARINELEKQTEQIRDELQGKTKELELALQQRKTLQMNLQELELRQQQPSVVSSGSIGEKNRQQQKQILEANTQKQALQNQVHDLELAAEQLKQVLQDKTKVLQLEKTQNQELTSKVQALVDEAAQQQVILERKTKELEQENKVKQTLQEKIRHLEQEIAQQQALQKTTAEAQAQSTQKLQDLQGKLQTLTQEETKLRATLKHLEQQATKDKTELQAKSRELEASNSQSQALQKQLEEQKKAAAASQQELQKKTRELEQETTQKRTALSKIQEVEKEKAAQQLKVSELQKELAGVKSRYTHITRLQPFLVEHMDFFNSASPEVFGNAFDRTEIKYIFSRMKIAVLADKPGKLNVLVKYMKPNGQLYFNPKSSPTGYSFAAAISYSPQEEYLYLSGWGSERETTFVAGNHQVEIYDETGRQLAKANFQVKEKIMVMSKIKSFF